MLLAKGFSQTVLFRHLSDNVFRVRNLKNTKSMRQSFGLNVQNFIWISKLRQEIDKKFFVSEISASELVSLNCLY